MKAPTYLAKNRHGGYLFRRAIPILLREVFPQGREIRKSLRTHHRPTALRQARALAAHFDKLFEGLLVATKSDYQKQIEKLLLGLRQTYERCASIRDRIVAPGNWSDEDSQPVENEELQDFIQAEYDLAMLETNQAWRTLTDGQQRIEPQIKNLKFKLDLIDRHESQALAAQLTEEVERELGLKLALRTQPIRRWHKIGRL